MELQVEGAVLERQATTTTPIPPFAAAAEAAAVIFTLETLNDEQGDCLLMHYGADHAPRFVLVDGDCIAKPSG